MPWRWYTCSKDSLLPVSNDRAVSQIDLHFQPIVLNPIGVTSAIKKLKSQLVAADMAVILCRIRSGAISAEYMKGIRNSPMGKNARAKKSKSRVAPATLLLSCEYLMSAAWPACAMVIPAAPIISSLRRPSRSTMNTANVAIQNCQICRHPEMTRDVVPL